VSRHLAALVLALAALLAGCGGATTDSAGDFKGAEQDVARTIEDLEEAGQEDEPRRICQALLAKDVVQRIEESGGDCTKAVDKALDQADTFTLTVESVRVTGDTARARVETGADEEKIETLELVREDDAWRISSLPGAS
jgi:phosphopantetheine adenylyltransferase